MNKNHSEALDVLVGLPVLEIGRAADLLWIHFAEWHTVPSRRKGSREVGDWALHIQTPWRIADKDRILTGYTNMHHYEEDNEFFDWDKDGLSRFDARARSLNRRLKSSSPTAERVTCGGFGDFELVLDDGLSISAFADVSSDLPDYVLAIVFACHRWRALRRRNGSLMDQGFLRNPRL